MKKIWKWLDGKKTIVGVSIHFVAYGLKGIKLVDEETFSALIALGDVVMAGGIAHKAFKFFAK